MTLADILKFLQVVGSFGVTGVVAAFVYWLLQKFFEKKFSESLEKYRHSLALAAQSEQMRLDLYNRRFEIFSSIFDFYEAMISWEGTPAQKAARTRFFRAYQESGFLFSKESGIEALLKQLNDQAAKVIGFKEHSAEFQADREHYLKLFQESTHIQLEVFSDGLEKLKTAMAGYLNFHQISVPRD